MTSEQFGTGETDKESPWLQERAARARRKAKTEPKPSVESIPPPTPRKRNLPSIWHWHEQAAAAAYEAWNATEQAEAGYNNGWWYYLREMKGHPALLENSSIEVVAQTLADLYEREQSLDVERPYWLIMADSPDVGSVDDLVALVHHHWPRIQTVVGESKLRAAYRRWCGRGFAHVLRIRWKHSLSKNPIGDPVAMLARAREAYRQSVDHSTPPGKRWTSLCSAVQTVGNGEMIIRADDVPYGAEELAFPSVQQAHYCLSVFELHSSEAYAIVASHQGRPAADIEWKNENGSAGWGLSYPVHLAPELLLGSNDAGKTFGRSATACRGWIHELVERGALRRTAYRRAEGESHRYTLDVPEWVFLMTAKCLPAWTKTAPSKQQKRGLDLD